MFSKISKKRKDTEKDNSEYHTEECALLYWDLETTSRSRSRIIEIGWTSDEVEGELLIIPRTSIDKNAGLVHGYDINKLISKGAKDAFTQLNVFMRSIESINKPVIMLAHNGKSFDTNVLRHELETENVRIANNIIGFVDTLHWMKYACKIKNAKLDDLIVEYLHEDVRKEHGALEDSRLLKRVVDYVRASNKELSYFESIHDFLIRTDKWSSEEEKIKDALEEMKFKLEHDCNHILHTDDNIQFCTECSYWRFIST